MMAESWNKTVVGCYRVRELALRHNGDRPQRQGIALRHLRWCSVGFCLHLMNLRNLNKQLNMVSSIISENNRRKLLLFNPVNQLTGEGVGEALGERRMRVHIPDHTIPDQWLTDEVLSLPHFRSVMKAGSITRHIESYGEDPRRLLPVFCDYLNFLRLSHDPAFAFALAFKIKDKRSGMVVPFYLNYAQRELLGEFERMRREGKPIRLVLLKARQWGGSTLVQLYMAWMQLFVKEGWNSLIVAQTKDTARRIKAMYSKVLQFFPVNVFRRGELRFSPLEHSVADSIITDRHGLPVRSNVTTVSSYENYESTRGSDIAMVHFSEVAFWRQTPQKSAANLIRAVTSGIAEGEPCTMEVMESTANGKSGYFYDEYQEAKAGHSARKAFFIPFFHIENDMLSFSGDDETRAFARQLADNRHNDVAGEKTSEPGSYLWSLWEKGATLEHIKWYVERRKSFHSHGQMASEAPSDDIECFTFSGQLLINAEKIAKMEMADKRHPVFRGDMEWFDDNDVRLERSETGPLKIWDMPECGVWHERYMVVVDVGGKTENSDYCVVTVIDRSQAPVKDMEIYNPKGDGLHVVARWRGHIRYDRLARKAVDIARWYDNAIVVFESNTFDKKKSEAQEHAPDECHAESVLDEVRGVYANLYMRSQDKTDDLRERPVSKVGFHTNHSTKQRMVDQFTKFFEDELIHDPDEEFYKELAIYERRSDGSYGNIPGYNNHDDIVMTDMIGCLVHDELMAAEPVAVVQKPPKLRFNNPAF